MSKELGMIHSSEFSYQVSSANNNDLVGPFPLDLAEELSNQLQRLVRQGHFFKVVGIDIGLSPLVGASGSVTGYLRYYAPTRQRCEAYRSAFRSMAELMKTQGISMRDNAQYDFRCALTNNPSLGSTFRNNATMDGVSGLALNHATTPGASVFGVHNENVAPTTTGVPDFSEGFDTILASGGAKTDFVLANTSLFSGNEEEAGLSFDKIPFTLSYGGGETTVSFQWRPDPALYTAVMCGLFELFIEDCSSPSALELDITVMTSGWKSIMGNPDKKKTRRMN
ncbi:MAG: hypothetical protein [Circular genetic element sp.]|nr:MAG: hypothetical protein [Circular genetic element sp.]